MAHLTAENLMLSYDASTVVEDLDLAVPEGKISVIIGANGSGKSTILRSLARLLQPKRGTVYLDGKDIFHLPTKAVAKQLSILPQSPLAPEGLTVQELCYYGRHPHKGFFSQNRSEDHEIVEWALEATKMKEFADRPLDALSGGQRQRAWISMCLSQSTELVLLDEPTTYLDLAHQIEVLDLLRDLNLKHRKTIVMVLHDLNQAARYADHLICIKEGKVYAEGAPDDIFTETMIHDVFGLISRVVKDPVERTPMCVPVKTCRCQNDDQHPCEIDKVLESSMV